MRTFLWGKAGLAAHILPAEQSLSQADPHDSQERPRAGLRGLGCGVPVRIQQAHKATVGLSDVLSSTGRNYAPAPSQLLLQSLTKLPPAPKKPEQSEDGWLQSANRPEGAKHPSRGTRTFKKYFLSQCVQSNQRQGFLGLEKRKRM